MLPDLSTLLVLCLNVQPDSLALALLVTLYPMFWKSTDRAQITDTSRTDEFGGRVVSNRRRVAVKSTLSHCDGRKSTRDIDNTIGHGTYHCVRRETHPSHTACQVSSGSPLGIGLMFHPAVNLNCAANQSRSVSWSRRTLKLNKFFHRSHCMRA
jgi:hypothetical protein